MGRVQTLKEAIAPLIWLNCIFLMGVFEIPINRPRFLLSAFYVVLMILGYCVLFYKGISIFERAFDYEFVIFYFVLGVNLFVAFLAIILFWRKSENLNNIIKRNSSVDATLDILGIKRNYQKIFCSVLCLLIGWIIGMLLLNLMHIIWMYRDVGYLVTLYTDVLFCFPIMINSVVDLTFASFIRCIKVKFQHINILLNNVVICANESNIFHDKDETKSVAIIQVNYKDRKDKVLHLIQTLRQLHLEATRIARQINGTFCFQLLLELAVHFSIVTATSYCLYAIFAGHINFNIRGEKIIAMTTWACVYSFKIIFVNNLCTCVTAEAYKAGEIIQSFEVSATENEMREEIQQFTQQVVLNPLKFTATGFFTIDNCFTGKFFATVTTYVVILIQMNAPVRE